MGARHAPAPIQFAPCPKNAAVECGKLTLPVDYKNPRQDDTFGMAVIRAKATDPAKRIGVLAGLTGGPGDSGVDVLLWPTSSASPTSRQHRDQGNGTNAATSP